jgi:predicted outer membrane repeat protein
MKTRKWLNRLLTYSSIVILVTMLIPARQAQAAGFAVVGTGTPASCTEAALDAALTLAPINIIFSCGAAPATINITTQKNISADVMIDGGQLVTLSGTLLNPTRLFNVSAGTALTLDYLTIENFQPLVGGGAAIYNAGTVKLNNVELTNNLVITGQDGGAVYNDGFFYATQSTLDNNTAGRFAGAIYNSATGIARMNNVTLSGNIGSHGGGGIYNAGGAVSLVNVTVFNNTADSGGSGIYSPSGSVILVNTIVAKGLPLGVNNCGGTITSNGYNLSSDTSCVSQLTDLSNTDPLLLPLGNYGGYTPTNRPQVQPSASLAIDAGTLTNCPSQDQRGKPRPFGLACDIGSVEIQGGTSPDGGSAGPWYVAPTGLDSNDCNLATAPCQTINGAIAKASAGDVIYVAQGTYTDSTYTEVVRVDKDMNILGGWDSTFTTENGMSTIDGQYARHGISVLGNAYLSIFNFVVQQGSATSGGGAYIEGALNGVDMVFQNNTAFSGGGIYVKKANGGIGNLFLNKSGIYYNTVTGYAGGIDLEDGGVHLSNVTLSYNEFLPSYPEEPAQGGSIYINKGGVGMVNVTSANNYATSGIYIASANGAIYPTSSIFADFGGCAGLTANISSFGHNIDWWNSCNLGINGDQVNTNPQLGPLQYNGGNSQTHALASYSPAIDAGDSTYCPGFDQRGVSRPQYATCDVGAYEFNGFRVDFATTHKFVKFRLGLNHPKGMLGVDTGDNSATMSGLDYRQRDLEPDRPMPTSAPLNSFDLYGFCDGSVCPAPVLMPSASSAMTSTYQLSSPITVTLPYSDSELSAAGISLASLRLVVLNPKTNQWHEIPVTVDEAENVVIAQTTYLGTYYLVGGPRKLFLPAIQRQ